MPDQPQNPPNGRNIATGLTIFAWLKAGACMVAILTAFYTFMVAPAMERIARGEADRVEVKREQTVDKQLSEIQSQLRELRQGQAEIYRVLASRKNGP